MATKRKASRTTAVMRGCVSTTALQTATAEKAPFCNQMLLSRVGHARLNPTPSRVGRSRAPCCSHSPGIGIGQMPHQPRPKNGSATSIMMVHHAIQTSTMPKL